ncbi:hypothetical protein AAG906_016069 [Vitis piasezkii]
MVLRNLHPRFAQHLVGIIFQNFRSLIHIIFNVEEGISRGLWTDSSPLDPMGKKPISSSRSVEVDSISSLIHSIGFNRLMCSHMLITFNPYFGEAIEMRCANNHFILALYPSDLNLSKKIQYVIQGIQVGPVTFLTLFQVLKVKFIHDGWVIMIRSSHDVAISFELILEISHSMEYLLGLGLGRRDNPSILEVTLPFGAQPVIPRFLLLLSLRLLM